MLYLNLGGHKLAPETAQAVEERGMKVLDIPVPNITISEEGFQGFVKEVMNLLKKSKATREQILTGQYVLLAPGLTPVAVSLIAALHGATGHFPKLSFLSRNAETGVFELGGIIDLFTLRLEYRDFFR